MPLKTVTNSNITALFRNINVLISKNDMFYYTLLQIIAKPFQNEKNGPAKHDTKRNKRPNPAGKARLLNFANPTL